MFSRNLLIVVGVALFIAINLTLITTTSRETLQVTGAERITIALVSPIQKAVSNTMGFTRDVWNTYFMAVRAVSENRQLKRDLGKTIEIQTLNDELQLENSRLKKFVNFTTKMPDTYVAA